MLNPRVASRYAKSLLDLAVEKGLLEQTYNDMLYLKQLTAQSKEFINLLRSPIIKAEVKIKAVNAVIAGKVNDLTISFIRLMIVKARESVLPEVIIAFVNQYKQYKHIDTVKLTTAMPVSDAVRKAIIQQLKANGRFENIELETIVDSNIIGGFILQSGDKLIDASIAYDLKILERKFENNDFIYRVR
jgi:F-type H+-transporting ATPase subunit delta